VLHTHACTRLCCNGEITLFRAAQTRAISPAQGSGLRACIRGPTCITNPRPSAACSHRHKISVVAKTALLRPLCPLHWLLHRWPVETRTASRVSVLTHSNQLLFLTGRQVGVCQWGQAASYADSGPEGGGACCVGQAQGQGQAQQRLAEVGEWHERVATLTGRRSIHVLQVRGGCCLQAILACEIFCGSLVHCVLPCYTWDAGWTQSKITGVIQHQQGSGGAAYSMLLPTQAFDGARHGPLLCHTARCACA